LRIESQKTLYELVSGVGCQVSGVRLNNQRIVNLGIKEFKIKINSEI
jgi:hypothetical protein